MGRICFGCGQLHRTLPEMPNQGDSVDSVLHSTIPEWWNHKGSVWGNLFWWTTAYGPPRNAESRGFCGQRTAQNHPRMVESLRFRLGTPVLLDNCTGPSRLADSGGLWKPGNLFWWTTARDPPRMAESEGFCLGKPVFVDNCTAPSQNDRIKAVLSRETCFGGQLHRTLPEWPNWGVLSRETCFGGQLHRALPEWPNQGGSVWGNLFLWTTAQNPPRMAESGG